MLNTNSHEDRQRETLSRVFFFFIFFYYYLIWYLKYIGDIALHLSTLVTMMILRIKKRLALNFNHNSLSLSLSDSNIVFSI